MFLAPRCLSRKRVGLEGRGGRRGNAKKQKGKYRIIVRHKYPVFFIETTRGLINADRVCP